MSTPTDQHLFDLILNTENEIWTEVPEPKARSMRVPVLVMEKLGHNSFVVAGVHKNPLFERICTLQNRLYRKQDLAVGGIHGGLFMFKGIAAKISIPIILGKAEINPIELCDLSDIQRAWLGSDTEAYARYLETFADVFDFAGGVTGLADYKTPSDGAKKLFDLATFQLQAAAAAICAAFDGRGAVQSSLIGAELALKGGLIEGGEEEKKLRNYGHDLAAAADKFAEMFPTFDRERVFQTLETLPQYVENRYSADQPSRTDAGYIVMTTQYVAGEVMRAVTGGSFARKLRTPNSQ